MFRGTEKIICIVFCGKEKVICIVFRGTEKVREDHMYVLCFVVHM